MRWMLTAASAAIAIILSLPGQAAQPGASTANPGTAAPAATPATVPGQPAGPAATDEPITFEQYREWRLNYIERRRSELAMQLSAGDMPAAQKARLEHVKAYYDWFAALPETDRDHRFRERFDRIDVNHDGKIDTAERSAWHDKQRGFYQRSASRRGATEPDAR